MRPGPLISLKCSASGSPPPQVSTSFATLMLHISPIKVASFNGILLLQFKCDNTYTHPQTYLNIRKLRCKIVWRCLHKGLFYGVVFVLFLQFAWVLDSQPIMDVSLHHRFAIGQFVDISGDVISHLNMSHVRPDDGGLYKCIATNSMGSVEHSARLNVYGECVHYCSYSIP